MWCRRRHSRRPAPARAERYFLGVDRRIPDVYWDGTSQHNLPAPIYSASGPFLLTMMMTRALPSRRRLPTSLNLGSYKFTVPLQRPIFHTTDIGKWRALNIAAID